MDLNETFTVRPQDARPAGKPDECFYCKRPLGALHKEGCVIRRKTVVVRLVTEVVISVPQDWDAQQVEFFYNDGSACLDSLTDELRRWEIKARKKGRCACDWLEVEFGRDATAADSARPCLVSEK